MLPRPPQNQAPRRTSPGRLHRAGAGITALMLASAALTAADVPWHHQDSPYRAHLEVTSQPNQPRVGLAVTVPICGLGNATGRDLFAFDKTGRQLQLLGLGPSVNNSVIAVVEPVPDKQSVFVYFGSGAHGPQNRMHFIPPLTVTIRSLVDGTSESWEEVEDLLRLSRLYARLFVDQIALMHNPANGADGFIMDFNGSLLIKEDREETLMLVSDDAGFLFVEEELLVARPGRHYAHDGQRGESRGTIKLTKGGHPLRCVVVEHGGGAAAVVARWIDGRDKHILKPDDFARPGKTELKAVEARGPDIPNPAFWYRQVSYMGIEARQFTEVEMGTYNTKEAAWRFADGSIHKGATVKRLFAGLRSQGVEVKQGGKTTAGTIDFAEVLPPQYSVLNPRHFEIYRDLVMAEDLSRLDPLLLDAYRFLLGYNEGNPDLLPVCEALLDSADLSAEKRQALLIEVARLSAGKTPKKSERAFDLALKGAEEPAARAQLLSEYGDFLLFERGDPDRAEPILRQVADLTTASPAMVGMLQVDLALQRDDVETARKRVETIRGAAEAGAEQAAAAVQASALQQRFYDLLNARYLNLSRAALKSWAALPTNDRFNGNLALARSRLWEEAGWLNAALACLNGAVLLDPLLPNLPDVELARARILRTMGNQEQMTETLQRIAKEYPNHPAAATAREWLK